MQDLGSGGAVETKDLVVYELDEILFGEGEDPMELAPTSLAVPARCSCGGEQMTLTEASTDPKIIRACVPGTELRYLRSVAEWLAAPKVPIMHRSRLHDKARSEALIMCASAGVGVLALGLVFMQMKMPILLAVLASLSAVGASLRVYGRTKRLATQEDVGLDDLFGVRVDSYNRRNAVYRDLTICPDCLQVGHPLGSKTVSWFRILEMYDLESSNVEKGHTPKPEKAQPAPLRLIRNVAELLAS